MPSKKGFEKFNRNCTIYFDDNVPIFITEVVKGEQTLAATGYNRNTKEYFGSFIDKTSVDVKVLINNWKTFEIFMFAGDNLEYILEHKEEYQKIVNEVLEITSRRQR